MRKITQHVTNAFMQGNPLKESNTQVTIEDNTVKMYLHGNLIAKRPMHSRIFSISNAGWVSNTTRERLNGLPRVQIRISKKSMILNGEPWSGGWTDIL